MIDPQLVGKFCKKMKKEFECDKYFEAVTNRSACSFCPLMLFVLTMNLALEKNLSIGDAFRLSLSNNPEQALIREKIRQIANAKGKEKWLKRI